MTKNNCILVISDQHIPYHHPDMMDFLKAIKKVYKPDRIVNIGDELDHHAISFHDSNPDLASAGDELRKSLSIIKEMEQVFPVMDLVHSNHGSLSYRRAFSSGIPTAYLKDYNEFLQVGKGWKWHEDIVIKASNGQDIYFCHGKVANIIKLGQQYGQNVVQGHYHTSFNIQYWGNPNALHWALQVGCLIDKDSLAYAYNKLFKNRPVIGTGIIINGLPKLLPMVLNKGGRWNKVVP